MGEARMDELCMGVASTGIPSPAALLLSPPLVSKRRAAALPLRAGMRTLRNGVRKGRAGFGERGGVVLLVEMLEVEGV